jgi:hypothetical protein
VDLNFTLTKKEIWGTSPRLDPLADYFKNLLQTSSLVDIQPPKMSPTWRNGRVGEEGIEKRLDHFLLSNLLLNHSHRVRTWVINSTISDHNSIVLQLDSFAQRSTPPFKFNSIWINEKDFSLLVKHTWNSISHRTDASFIHYCAQNCSI